VKAKYCRRTYGSYMNYLLTTTHSHLLISPQLWKWRYIVFSKRAFSHPAARPASSPHPLAVTFSSHSMHLPTTDLAVAVVSGWGNSLLHDEPRSARQMAGA
jgi:hypothetical protein